ncbi:MAG: VTT domain-containing protein [Clostridia bacterium]|nr:VTT domain-containing protein [Clostridia bacterium]
MVLLPVPGSVAVAVGTAMFGPLKCSIFSFIGIVAGSVVAFAIGRLIGYKAVCWIVGKESLDKWLNKLKGKDYLILSLMFLLPLFPDDILCFVAGMSSMTWGYFIIMIIVTRAISVFSSAYSFELIPFTTWWGILIWILIAALVVLSFYLVCKYYEKIDYFIKNKLKINGRKR